MSEEKIKLANANRREAKQLIINTEIQKEKTYVALNNQSLNRSLVVDLTDFEAINT